jgi:hypothetical protein
MPRIVLNGLNIRNGMLNSGKGSFGAMNAPFIMVQIRDKFGSLEHPQKNVIKLYKCLDQKQRSFFNGMGLFLGRNRGIFAPLIVKSVDKHAYVKMLEYLLLYCSRGRLGYPRRIVLISLIHSGGEALC